MWRGGGPYQLRDHDGPQGGEVLRGDAQQEDAKHQEDLGGDGGSLVHA